MLTVVAIVEIASAIERLTDSREVSRRDVEVVRPVLVVMVALIGMRVTAETCAIDRAADRRMVGCRNGFNAGKTAEGLDGLGKEESGARSDRNPA